jgi:hypothetical protein
MMPSFGALARLLAEQLRVVSAVEDEGPMTTPSTARPPRFWSSPFLLSFAVSRRQCVGLPFRKQHPSPVNIADVGPREAVPLLHSTAALRWAGGCARNGRRDRCGMPTGAVHRGWKERGKVIIV